MKSISLEGIDRVPVGGDLFVIRGTQILDCLLCLLPVLTFSKKGFEVQGKMYNSDLVSKVEPTACSSTLCIYFYFLDTEMPPS